MSYERWALRTVGESVLGELARFGPQGAMGDVVAAWPDAVGAGIAAEAWPARIARDGTLTIATSSSVWAFELTQLEATVRERLAAALGDGAPKRLRFVPGRLPERGPGLRGRLDAPAAGGQRGRAAPRRGARADDRGRAPPGARRACRGRVARACRDPAGRPAALICCRSPEMRPLAGLFS